MNQAGVVERPVEESGSTGHKRAATLVAICALAYFADGLVFSIIGPFAAGIARSLSLSKAELGPIFSASLAGQCAGLIVIPMLAGRYGQRAMVVVSLAAFGVAQALSGVVDDQLSLIVLRILVGFFLGGTLPICLALVAGAVRPERRGSAISGLFTGYALGAILSGFVGSIFVGPEGWRSGMVAVGVICLGTAVLAWAFLVEPPVPIGQPSAAPRRLAFALFGRPYLLGTLMLWVTFIGMLTINYCLGSWLPILLSDVGRSKAIASLSVSIFTAGGLISTITVGPLMDRFGVQRILVGFLIVSIAGLFAIGQALQDAPLPLLIGLLIVTGFFNLGSYGGVNVVLANFYPDEIRAMGIGYTKSVGRVGTVIAPIAIGLGLNAGVSETTMMSLFALPAAITTVAVLIIGAAAASSSADRR